MRRRNSVHIDLTPLLDVILIILFLVILTSHKQTQQAVEQAEQQAQQAVHEMADQKEVELKQKASEIADLEQQIAKFETENKLLRELNAADDETIQALDVLKQQSVAYKISIPDKYPDQPLQLLDLQSGATNNYLNQVELAKALKQKMTAGDDIVFILILEYNNKKILLRDYRKINQSILQLRADLQKTILYREVDRANLAGR